MVQEILNPLHQHMPMPAQPLEEPRLVQASDGLGWDGFTIRLYDEPAVMEHWPAPDTAPLTLVMVTRGALRLEQRLLDGPWQTYQIRQGDLLLRAPARAPYELRWTVTSPEPAQTLHINVLPAFVLRAVTTLGDKQACDEVIERVGFQDPVLAQIGAQLGTTLAQAMPTDALYAQTAVQFLVAHVLRYHVARVNSATEYSFGLTQTQVEQIAEYVRAHLHEPLTLEGLAAVAGYSPYHFARLFRQTTGDSPYQYVLQQRVLGAQQLLRETSMPVQQVALACGFPNQSHFTRVFHRLVGTPPGTYRRATVAGARMSRSLVGSG